MSKSKPKVIKEAEFKVKVVNYSDGTAGVMRYCNGFDSYQLIGILQCEIDKLKRICREEQSCK